MLTYAYETSQARTGEAARGRLLVLARCRGLRRNLEPRQSAYKMLAGNSADTLYVHQGVVASSAPPCTAVAIFAGSSFLKRPAGDANHRQDSRWACGEDGVGDNE